MMKRYTLPHFQQQSLLTRIFAALITIVVTAAAIFVGAFFLVAFVGLAVIAALVIWARLWWIRRKMAQQGTATYSAQTGSTHGRPGSATGGGGRIIEGDAEVKSTSRSTDDDNNT